MIYMLYIILYFSNASLSTSVPALIPAFLIYIIILQYKLYHLLLSTCWFWAFIILFFSPYTYPFHPPPPDRISEVCRPSPLRSLGQLQPHPIRAQDHEPEQRVLDQTEGARHQGSRGLGGRMWSAKSCYNSWNIMSLELLGGLSFVWEREIICRNLGETNKYIGILLNKCLLGVVWGGWKHGNFGYE